MAIKHLLLDLESVADPVPSRDVALTLARDHDALVTALHVRMIRERPISATACSSTSA